MATFLVLLPPSHKKLVTTVVAVVVVVKKILQNQADVKGAAVQFPVAKQRLDLNHDQYQVWDYDKKWEEQFSWLEFDEDSQVHFAKSAKKSGKSLQWTGGTWVTKPFTNWKNTLEKMRAYSKSDLHLRTY